MNNNKEYSTECTKNDNVDMVNKPPHYSGKYECIDIMKEEFGSISTEGFCLLNAFKYIYRCRKKGNYIQDIKKAIWYLNKIVSLNEINSSK